MAERSRAVEERLSDALHERLTQRFVDRRTAVLMRDLSARGAAEYPVVVDEYGEVSVGSHAIGRMQGFSFEVDPAARHSDRKMLLAAAERRLGGEFERRAGALVADSDDHFSLRTDAAQPVAILWRGHEVARLGPGKNLLSPRALLDRRLDRVSEAGREAARERLDRWLRARAEQHLGPLRAAGAAARDVAVPPDVRAVLALLVDEGGVAERAAIAAPLGRLGRDDRRLLSRLKVRIGALDLFLPEMLKPEPMRWRTALRVASAGGMMPALPPPSAVLLDTPSDDRRALLKRLGFRALGPQMLRVDLVERLARHAHEARAGKRDKVVDEALATSIGLTGQSLARLLTELGFQPTDGAAGWIWRGRRGKRKPGGEPAATGRKANAFAALAELRRG